MGVLGGFRFAKKMMKNRKKIAVGSLFMGGDAPITVQSMTNTPSDDFDATYKQMKALEAAGCDIIRMAVPDKKAVDVLYRLKCSDITMPIVADIHFNASLAIMAMEAGADKVRINPGNIGDNERATAEALAASALENVKLLERFDFDNIVVAIKSSDVFRMVEANRIVAASCPYPLHLGVTEAGTELAGTVKSAVGIGSLLLDGIGNTIRVSLTADPVREVEKGRAILSALSLDSRAKIQLVSCPTCGRTKIDLISLVQAFEARMDELHPPRFLKVAIMGCAVNGPGEARDADLGIAGGVGEALLFSHGEIIRKIPEERVVDELIAAINAFVD